MKWRMVLALLAAASLWAQSSGGLTGRIATEGGQEIRGEVLAVAEAGAVRLQAFPTDDRGVFRIELPVGRVLLVARAEGYVSEERRVLVLPGARNATVEFVLAPAGVVSGQVFDENGNPVAGARVWVNYQGERRAWHLEQESTSAATDASGNFVLPAVAQGRPFVLHAETDARLPSSSGTLLLRAPNMPGVVLLMSRPGASVRGRVVDSEGAGVPGAEVRVRVTPAAGEFAAEQRASIVFARSTNKATVSGADGSYVLRGIPPGRAVITTDAGGRRAFAEVEVRSGQETEVDLAVR